MVRSQDPGHNAAAEEVPCPIGGFGTQRYVYVPVPPVGAAIAVPSHALKQVTSVEEDIETVGPVKSPTLAIADPVHPLSSVTVYV